MGVEQIMPILTKCTNCYGKGAWYDGSTCRECKGTGEVKPYRRALTMGEWEPEWGPINSWPRFGEPGKCCVCNTPLVGRQRSFCGNKTRPLCRDRLWGRLYEGVHWLKRHVVVRDGCHCRSCGEVFESPLIEGGPCLPESWRLELDHILPLHLGGTDHPDNLQLLCVGCHRAKTSREAPLHADRRRGQGCVGCMGDNPQTEPVVPNSYEDFINRYEALKQEAAGYGISSTIVLMEDDMLDQTESKIILWSRGHMVSLGMLEWAKHALITMAEEGRRKI